MSFYTRLYDFLAGATVRSQEFDDEFNAIQSGFGAVETRLQAAIQTPENTNQVLPNTASRVNKILSFDGSGNVSVTSNFTGSFGFSGNLAVGGSLTAGSTVSCADPTAATHAATKQWVQTLALSSTISVTPGDSGKVLGNNGVVVGWQIGIPSLAGKASKFLKANGGETDVLFADAAEVPIGSAILLAAENTANTVTAQGATYLKTGVISNRATYPAAQLKSYTLCSTASTTPAESLYCLYGVASHGVVIAPVNGASTSVYAFNGASWAAKTLPASMAVGQMVTSGSRVFAAGSAADTGVYSDDLTTWTSVTLPSSTSSWWRAQCYGSGKFIIARNSSVNTIQHSANCSTWTSATMPISSLWLVRFVGSLYVAVPSGSTSTYYTSPDLTTWTPRTLPETATWTALQTTVNGRMVVQSGTSPYLLYYTTDGINWTSTSSQTKQGALMCHASGRYIYAASGMTQEVYSSTDLSAWHQDWVSGVSHTNVSIFTLGADGYIFPTNGTNPVKAVVDSSGYVGNPTNKTVDVGDARKSSATAVVSSYYIRVA